MAPRLKIIRISGGGSIGDTTAQELIKSNVIIAILDVLNFTNKTSLLMLLQSTKIQHLELLEVLIGDKNITEDENFLRTTVFEAIMANSSLCSLQWSSLFQKLTPKQGEDLRKHLADNSKTYQFKVNNLRDYYQKLEELRKVYDDGISTFVFPGLNDDLPPIIKSYLDEIQLVCNLHVGYYSSQLCSFAEDSLYNYYISMQQTPLSATYTQQQECKSSPSFFAPNISVGHSVSQSTASVYSASTSSSSESCFSNGGAASSTGTAISSTSTAALSSATSNFVSQVSQQAPTLFGHQRAIQCTHFIAP